MTIILVPRDCEAEVRKALERDPEIVAGPLVENPGYIFVDIPDQSFEELKERFPTAVAFPNTGRELLELFERGETNG